MEATAWIRVGPIAFNLLEILLESRRGSYGMFYANVTVDTRNPVNPFLRRKPVFTEQRCAARGKLEPRGNVSYDRFTPGNFPPRDIARIYTDDSPLFSFVRSFSLSLSPLFLVPSLSSFREVSFVTLRSVSTTLSIVVVD